jgi:cytoskeletal protein CcmA (bactofilin family)
MWRKPEENKSASAAHEISTTPVSTSVVDRPAAVAITPPAAHPHVTHSAAPPSLLSPNATAQPAGRISRTLTIKGEITGSDDMFVDGDIQGKISIAEGRVTIGANGRVTADIVAREIVVQGNVKGNLHGRERVQIGSTGCARGNVITRRFVVDDGAEIHGHVEIGPAESQAQESRSAMAKFVAPAGEEVEVTAAHARESRIIA